MGTPALDAPTQLRDAASPARHPALGTGTRLGAITPRGTPEHPSASHPHHQPEQHPQPPNQGWGEGCTSQASWEAVAPLNQIQGQVEGETGRARTFFLPLGFSPLVLEEKAFKKGSLVGWACWNKMLDRKLQGGERQWGRHRGWKRDASQSWEVHGQAAYRKKEK